MLAFGLPLEKIENRGEKLYKSGLRAPLRYLEMFVHSLIGESPLQFWFLDNGV